MHKSSSKGTDTQKDSVSVNKYIADSGFCSRREADKYVEQARVTINDEIALRGSRVPLGAVVQVDGERVGRKKAAVYLLYNKPPGITSTTDRKDRSNIIDAIGYPQRIFPVGRLDKDSEGLILLTNEGDIVNKMLRAGNAHEKEYIVTVDRAFGADFVAAMARGVRILGETTLPCNVQALGGSTFRIVLVQGLNRQIRRMTEVLGFKVKTLRRVRIMNLSIGNLRPGQYRLLAKNEVSELLNLIKTSSSEPIAPAIPKSAGTKDKTNYKKQTPARMKAKDAVGKSFKEFRKAGKGRKGK